MLKLWGRVNSSNVQKVIWLLEELHLPYDRVDVGGPFGGTATPDYRAMNPLGVVPSLQDGNFAVFESNVILRYLCNAHAPASPFYPADPSGRAAVESWMDFQQTSLGRPQTTVFQGLVRTPPEQRDNAAITAAIKELSGIYAILDARLARHPYMIGDSLTLADMVYGPHVHRWLKLDIPGRPELAHLSAWYERFVQRPAYAKHLAIEIT